MAAEPITTEETPITETEAQEQLRALREQLAVLRAQRATMLWFIGETLARLIIGMPQSELITWIEVYKEVLARREESWKS